MVLFLIPFIYIFVGFHFIRYFKYKDAETVVATISRVDIIYSRSKNGKIHKHIKSYAEFDDGEVCENVHVNRYNEMMHGPAGSTREIYKADDGKWYYKEDILELLLVTIPGIIMFIPFIWIFISQSPFGI